MKNNKHFAMCGLGEGSAQFRQG